MKTVAILGFGGRGINYGNLCKSISDKFKIVAVVDNNKDKLDLAAKQHNLSSDMLFDSVDSFFKAGKIADILFVCTQDSDHYAHTMPALDLGYDILLEKPISNNLKECIEIEQKAKKLNRKIVVCHVLRYSQFYLRIQEAIKRGAIGKLISIEMVENVAYWHQAHSFVRGNWRNSDSSSPMILAKCCHDLDLAQWLAGGSCEQISSQGTLNYFNSENAPEGATARCTDGCKAKANCPYDAEKLYINRFKRIPKRFGKGMWPYNIICNDGIATIDKLWNAIKTGPYGRCVFHCDNNVVDHQNTNMIFDNGVTVNLTMTAFSNDSYREIRVRGTHGEIIGNMNTNQLVLVPFGGKAKKIKMSLGSGISGHGGGDKGLIMALSDESGNMETHISRSIMSHVMAMAAEKSRLEGGKVVSVEEIKAQALKS